MKNDEDCWNRIVRYRRFFRWGMEVAVGIITALIFTSILVVTELTGTAILTVLGLPISCLISLILVFALIIIFSLVDRKSVVTRYFREVVECIKGYFPEGENEFKNIDTGRNSTIIKYAEKNWLLIPQVNSFIIVKYREDEAPPFMVGVETVLRLKRARRKSEVIGMDEVAFFQSRLYTKERYRKKLIWGRDEGMLKLTKEIVDYLDKFSLKNKVRGITPGIFNGNNLLIFNVVIPDSGEELEMILNALTHIVDMVEG